MASISSIKVDGFSTEYLKFGTGEKTLVILPGLSIQRVVDNATEIEKQYSVFKDRFTVYLFERRKELPSLYSVYDMADDTASAVKALKLDNVYLFGVSQGGMIALTLACRYPELVHKLAVCSTAANIENGVKSAVDDWIGFAENRQGEELYLSFAENVYPDSIFNDYKEFFLERAKHITDKELIRFVILAKAVKGFDIRNELCRIDCPVFVAGDYQDKIFGASPVLEIAEELKHNQGFELYMYDGFGHAVYDTAPDYTQRLFDFFNTD